MSVHLIQVVRINGPSTSGTGTTTTTITASTSTQGTAKTSGTSKSHLHHQKQLPRERLFLRFDDDTTLSMTVTDMIHVYQGRLDRSFVDVSDDHKQESDPNKHDEDAPKTIENVIREALTSLDSNPERKAGAIEGEIRNADESGKWILSIKKRRGENTKELIRLAEILLDETPNANIAEYLSNFLEVSIRERNEREDQLARESRLRESEMEKSRMYCAELLSKANEREQVTNELTKRFLAILNTKKEKIHELMEQVQELEAGAMEAREERAKQREEEGNGERSEKPKKPRGRPAAKAKNTEKDEAQAKVVAAKARRIAESTELKKPKKARVEEEDEEKEGTEAKAEPSETPSKSTTAAEQSEPLHRVNTRSSTKRISNGGSTTQDSSDKSSAATTTKSKSNGPITEDEFGPLPPGWEVTTSRTTGKRCYQNKILGKKQHARPTVPTVQHSTATQSTHSTMHDGSNNKKKTKHSIADDDEDGDPTSKILKDFL